MRIISQDGCFDFNYDTTNLVVAGGFVKACPISDSEVVIFANYASEDEAKKALFLLHKAYRSMHTIKTKDGVTYYEPPKVWQFPAELEA